MQQLTYIALGTKQRDPSIGEKTIITAPWDIYAVQQSGKPPYYRVSGVEDGEFTYEELDQESYEFGRIRKWIEERNILKIPEAKANVSKEHVMEMLST